MRVCRYESNGTYEHFDSKDVATREFTRRWSFRIHVMSLVNSVLARSSGRVHLSKPRTSLL